MKRPALAVALFCAAVGNAWPVLADNIQIIPPTPIGTMDVCTGGLQQVLTYSGSGSGSGQAGMNCVPITTDAAGDLAASGFVQIGNTNTACNASRAGAIRFNPSTATFEGCNGTGWQALGGGSTVGKLYWDGNWTGDHYWCDSGYHVVGFHYDCGCSNNATWFECQAN